MNLVDKRYIDYYPEQAYPLAFVNHFDYTPNKSTLDKLYLTFPEKEFQVNNKYNEFDGYQWLTPYFIVK